MTRIMIAFVASEIYTCAIERSNRGVQILEGGRVGRADRRVLIHPHQQVSVIWSKLRLLDPFHHLLVLQFRCQSQLSF